MISVASIVEGDGEVAALPVLLRRLGEWRTPLTQSQVLAPIRVQKNRFLNRDEEFSRHLLLAAKKSGTSGWILVLLDADDDCPVTKASEILHRAKLVVPHKPVAVVLANREYEAWFIASAESLNGHRSFTFRATDHRLDPDMPRDAKGWMRERMGSAAYGETTDQPAFSARMDLQAAFDRSRSFRKLCSEWTKNTRPVTESNS